MTESWPVLWWILALLAATLVVLRTHLWFWRRRLALPVTYAAVQEVPTDDGLSIELRHLPPERPARSSEPPVLLVHGIAVNHRNNDPCPELSLARHLQAQGRDVWLLTLRSALGRPSLFGDPRRSFKAMRDHDLPTAVRHLRRCSGVNQVDICAFSMGGMVLYAALGHTVSQRHVRRVVILGSPGRAPSLGPLKWLRWLPRRLVPTVPMRAVLNSLAFAYPVLPRSAHMFFYNPSNCPAPVARHCMVELFEDLPGSLGADFLRWAYNGGQLEVDGRPVLEQLAWVNVPVHFFAGGADRIAPPDTVRAAYEAWGRCCLGVEKQYTLLSTEHGARGDYGHGDLAFGRHAAEEVYEPVARFLAKGTSPRPARSSDFEGDAYPEMSDLRKGA